MVMRHTVGVGGGVGGGGGAFVVATLGTNVYFFVRLLPISLFPRRSSRAVAARRDRTEPPTPSKDLPTVDSNLPLLRP